MIGVGELPPQEMVGEGRRHQQEDCAGGGNEGRDVCVDDAGLWVRAQQVFALLFPWVVVAFKVIRVQNPGVVVSLEEPGIGPVAGETLPLKVHVDEPRQGLGHILNDILK